MSDEPINQPSGAHRPEGSSRRVFPRAHRSRPRTLIDAVVEALGWAGGYVPSREACRDLLALHYRIHVGPASVQRALDALVAEGILERDGQGFRLAQATGPEHAMRAELRRQTTSDVDRQLGELPPGIRRRLAEAAAEVDEAKKDAVTWRAVARELTERLVDQSRQLSVAERELLSQRSSPGVTEARLRAALELEREQRQRDVEEFKSDLTATAQRLHVVEETLAESRKRTRSFMAVALLATGAAAVAVPFVFHLHLLYATGVVLVGVLLSGTGIGVRFGRISVRVGSLLAVVSGIAAVYYLLSEIRH